MYCVALRVCFLSRSLSGATLLPFFEKMDQILDPSASGRIGKVGKEAESDNSLGECSFLVRMLQNNQRKGVDMCLH